MNDCTTATEKASEQLSFWLKLGLRFRERYGMPVLLHLLSPLETRLLDSVLKTCVRVRLGHVRAAPQDLTRGFQLPYAGRAVCIARPGRAWRLARAECAKPHAIELPHTLAGPIVGTLLIREHRIRRTRKSHVHWQTVDLTT